MSNPLNRKYPEPGIAMSVVVKELIDKVDDLKIFRDFVLQDPITLEKYEQYKTFRILKDQ